MREYRLRTDLKRIVIDDYALPLGIDPGDSQAPEQGYTLTYSAGNSDEPESYSFHIVVSHEKIPPILHRAFELLPSEVVGIVEAGSRDAYRTVDIFLGLDTISREHFLESWEWYEPFLLEDCFLAAGANSEDPYVEVFLDQWKGVSIHVPLSLRGEVEDFLAEFGLEEVIETWSSSDSEDILDSAQVRPVLDLADEYDPDIDEMILELRHEWDLELNIDPENNSDESGRELGLTLWHAMVIVDNLNGNPEGGAYASIWATAGSLDQMSSLISDALEQERQWQFNEIYTIDRVAYDERPDDLIDIAPRRDLVEVHSINFETWPLPDPQNIDPRNIDPRKNNPRKSDPGEEE